MDQIKPTRNQKQFVGLMYLTSFVAIPYLFFSFFEMVFMISSIAEIPYYVRFHWTQMARIGLIALPGVVLAFIAAVLDEFVFKPLPAWAWNAALIIAAILVLISFCYSLVGAYYGFTGQYKKLLPGKEIII